jgi:Reverse transcriptase (RNA-dependent DNA polymerase)
MPPDRGEHNFKIRLVAGARPQVRRHGRLSEREVQEMKTKIKELLAIGHIRPSNSPWSAPILFVHKKDGTMRMCIDYRALNELTIHDEYSLPRIDAIFDKLRKAKYFSTLDLNMAYHQVRIDEDSQVCTAFTCEEGQYEFKVMTFGFTNAPPTFQRMMMTYLREFLGTFVEVYLDDILIYSETWEEYLRHIEKVLQRLREVKLMAKMNKCKWGRTKVEYLGHVIGKGKI